MGRTRMVDVSDDPHLTDELWKKLEPMIPVPEPGKLGGRPPHSARACLAGVLFVLITGCQWQKLPKNYPSPSTCWRRFEEWTSYGIFEGIWLSLLSELQDLGRIAWREAAADAWFARAKKGAIAWEKPSVAREPRLSTSLTEPDFHLQFMLPQPPATKPC